MVAAAGRAARTQQPVDDQSRDGSEHHVELAREQGHPGQSEVRLVEPQERHRYQLAERLQPELVGEEPSTVSESQGDRDVVAVVVEGQPDRRPKCCQQKDRRREQRGAKGLSAVGLGEVGGGHGDRIARGLAARAAGWPCPRAVELPRYPAAGPALAGAGCLAGSADFADEMTSTAETDWLSIKAAAKTTSTAIAEKIATEPKNSAATAAV